MNKRCRRVAAFELFGRARCQAKRWCDLNVRDEWQNCGTSFFPFAFAMSLHVVKCRIPPKHARKSHVHDTPEIPSSAHEATLGMFSYNSITSAFWCPRSILAHRTPFLIPSSTHHGTACQEVYLSCTHRLLLSSEQYARRQVTPVRKLYEPSIRASVLDGRRNEASIFTRLRLRIALGSCSSMQCEARVLSFLIVET